MALSRKENLLRTLKSLSSQKIPWVPFAGVHCAKVLGVSVKEYLHSSDLVSKAVVAAARLYNADGITISFDLSIEAELLGATTKYLEKFPPAIIKYPLANADISDLVVYNPNSGRLKVILDSIERTKVELGDDTALIAVVSGVLTLAYQLRGCAILDDIANKSQSLYPLLAYCKDIQLKTINAYIERGVDVVAIVEPLCNNLDIGFFKEFLAPLENELFDYINSENLPSCFFLCGDVNMLLDEICKTNCDNICVCSNVDLETLKKKALKAKKSFGGNLSPSADILNATEQEAIQRAKECMAIGGGNGYVLSSGCDLDFDSPMENLIAISKI